MKIIFTIACLLISTHVLADTPDTPAGPNPDAFQVPTFLYYNDYSMRANPSELGKCTVKVTITAAGKPIVQGIEKSSGYKFLDNFSCGTLIEKLLWIPATHKGHAVQSTISVPMEWIAGSDGQAHALIAGVVPDAMDGRIELSTKTFRQMTHDRP
jgi:hypothetical protein